MNTLYICLTFLIFATCIAENLACTKEIRAFVDGHNSRRLRIAKGQVGKQPGAAEMKMVIWDKELEAKATAWAALNKGSHNPDRTVPSGRFGTGENLYTISTTNQNYKLDADGAVQAWFSEHANYTYGPLQTSDFDGSKNYQIGHYTQLAWSNSIYLGCGVSHTHKGQWNTFFVVCNYGPTGNYIGDVPYKKGGPISKLSCGCAANDKLCNNCKNLYGSQC